MMRSVEEIERILGIPRGHTVEWDTGLGEIREGLFQGVTNESRLTGKAEVLASNGRVHVGMAGLRMVAGNPLPRWVSGKNSRNQ